MKPCNSFYNMGKTLEKCFDCSYCLIKNTNFENIILPKDKTCAVSVNLFYGDPMLQVENTIEILKNLKQNEHTGKIIIITKGNFNLFPIKNWGLDLHVGFSTFGINNELDGGSLKQFQENLKNSIKHKNINFHIEFRPIIKDINDNIKDINFIMNLAEQYNFPVAYGGLYSHKKKTSVDLSSYNVPTYRKTLELICSIKSIIGEK